MWSHEEYLSDNRYTYGQPVRGRADILVTIKPYGTYDRNRYGSKSVNVEVCITVTFASSYWLFLVSLIVCRVTDCLWTV